MKWVLLLVAAFLSFACIPSLEGARREGIAQRKALPPTAVGTAPAQKCDALNSKHAGQVAFATGVGEASSFEQFTLIQAVALDEPPFAGSTELNMR